MAKKILIPARFGIRCSQQFMLVLFYTLQQLQGKLT